METILQLSHELVTLDFSVISDTEITSPPHTIQILADKLANGLYLLRLFLKFLIEKKSTMGISLEKFFESTTFEMGSSCTSSGSSLITPLVQQLFVLIIKVK